MNLEGYSIRFAVPEDSESFTRWATENPDIAVEDIQASFKENNPTCIVLVVEREGIPVLFAPFYCSLTLAYLGFNPDKIDEREKLTALEIMKRGAVGFALIHGIREINTTTTADRPVAKWAKKHGFEPDGRQLYRLKIDAPEGE